MNSMELIVEQIILNQFAVVKNPEGYSFIRSSTLPMNGLTARLSLDLLNLNKEQVLAVTGGPGAYGGYVIQLAKADGLTVIADANENDIELLNELGVDHIIPRGKNFVEKIKEVFPVLIVCLMEPYLTKRQLTLLKIMDLYNVRGFKRRTTKKYKFYFYLGN